MFRVSRMTELIRLYAHPEAVLLDDWRSRCAIERVTALPADAGRPCLWASPTHLELHVSDRRLSGIWVSVADLERRSRQGSELTRACGRLAAMTVLDPMSGWGIDGLLLTAAGAQVTMIERNPLMALLLQDLLRRLRSREHERGEARSSVVTAPGAHGRWQGARAACGDGYDALTSDASDSSSYDIVYLDPMFPERDKRALPNKRMQASATLFEVDQARHALDVGAWIAAARQRARRRVVLKRRLRDPDEFAPDWQIRGKSVRYDVWRGLAVDFS